MSEPAVEVEGLTVRFGGFTAVDDVSFTVDRGEIFGFLGANGAGKTTTIRALCGLLTPTAGRLKVAGRDAAGDQAALKTAVGYMSQRFTLYEDLTVEENLSFAAALRKMPRERLLRRTGELFGIIGFDKPVSTLVRDLPGGMKQEMSLAAAMLHDPELIFLDEPTAGVSPAARARFWSLIRSVAARGKTVFVTTHYMDEAEQCGRVALMRAGRLIALDAPEALKDAAFPEPLFAARATPASPRDWLESLRREPCVLEERPHGLTRHVVARDAPAWEESAKRLGLESRRIRPSLEDVFIRLVEGRER